ncbi:hypothetical protein MTR_7g024940 [Medicago truncatula]|uniref:Uncharacterized protein n=1 Tax=Medicago truncatula TaxID=3880 RepID=G7KXW4_MEDTR|nr:hypothetical protein MTR_7g024940 [Medicago truncatula]
MNEGGKNLCLRLLKIDIKNDIYVPNMDAPPTKSFATFDVNKILRITELYPTDILDVSEGVSDLCAKLVEINKCSTFAIVYKLLKLILLLPVTTASVEHVFFFSFRYGGYEESIILHQTMLF